MPLSTWRQSVSSLLPLLCCVNLFPSPARAQEPEPKKGEVIVLEIIAEESAKEGNDAKQKSRDDKKAAQQEKEAAKKRREGEKAKPKKQHQESMRDDEDDDGDNDDRKEQKRERGKRGEHPDASKSHSEGPPPRSREDRPQKMTDRDERPERDALDALRSNIEQQRLDMQEQARQIRAMLDEARGQFAERAERNRIAPEELQKLERKTREFAERLEVTSHQLKERSQENEKLRAALEEREKTVIILKKELQAREQMAKNCPGLKDQPLAARVERIEAELKNILAAVKAKQAEAAPSVKQAAPQRFEGKVIEKKQQPKVIAPNSGVTVIEVTPAAKAEAAKSPPVAESPKIILELKPVAPADVPPPTPKAEEAPIPAPMPAIPLAPEAKNAAPSALGGVGTVEGDVTAILPQEGKIVLKVFAWHDGKTQRTDWVGQQVSIAQQGLPAVKVGDHISLDARIDAQKGFVWGGKVFNGSPKPPVTESVPPPAPAPVPAPTPK